MADAAQNTTYQMVTLTSGLAEKIIDDDSPQAVIGDIWEFMNSALMTANLTWVDFQNILDFVDIRFANMLLGIPEDKWINVEIKETVYDRDESGEVFPVHVKTYNIVQLWDATRAKVYIKCCNSRDGHLLRTLTESRSSIKQLYREEGTPNQVVNPVQGATQKSNWRPI